MGISLRKGREEANPANELRDGGPSATQQDPMSSSIFPRKFCSRTLGFPLFLYRLYSETHPRLAQVTYQHEPPQPTVELLTEKGERERELLAAEGKGGTMNFINRINILVWMLSPFLDAGNQFL